MTIDTVVFDIDGVLIDTRESYTEVIRETVTLYSRWFLGFKSSEESLLSRQEVDQFKYLGGFNNDWDAVYGLLIYFQSLCEKAGKNNLNNKELKRLKKISDLHNNLPSPCGIKNIKKLLKGKSLIHYHLAKQIFQELYLGKKIYEDYYKQETEFINNARGFCQKEKMLIPKKVFTSLKKNNLKLGIATGRNRYEAEMVLNRFKIKDYFKSIVTDDDVGTFRKPHPFPLLKNAEKLKSKGILYIGDLPDDIKTGNSAKKKIKAYSAGMLYGQDKSKEVLQAFQKAKADFIIKNPEEILDIVHNLQLASKK